MTPDQIKQALDAAREEGRRAGLAEACAKLQEAADDWRSDGCDLPAKHIEDEIPLIRALIDKPGDPVAGYDPNRADHGKAWARARAEISSLLPRLVLADTAGGEDREAMLDIAANNILREVSIAPADPVAEAARVLLYQIERARIPSHILERFYRGELTSALRALAQKEGE